MILEENINGLELVLCHDIQKVYAELFGKIDFYAAEKLKRFNGMNNDVQEGYIESFKRGWINSSRYFEHINHVKKMYNVIGIPPSQELLAKYPQYTEYFGDVQ